MYTFNCPALTNVYNGIVQVHVRLRVLWYGLGASQTVKSVSRKEGYKAVKSMGFLRSKEGGGVMSKTELIKKPTIFFKCYTLKQDNHINTEPKRDGFWPFLRMKSPQKGWIHKGPHGLI